MSIPSCVSLFDEIKQPLKNNTCLLFLRNTLVQEKKMKRIVEIEKEIILFHQKSKTASKKVANETF